MNNSKINFRNRIDRAHVRAVFVSIAIALVCFALSPAVLAQDGAVGDCTSTAEGTGALGHLTSGNTDTAMGNLSLVSVTTGSGNYALVAIALYSSNRSFNTATGSGTHYNCHICYL